MGHVRKLFGSAQRKLKGKHHASGWVLPKQRTSFAPEGTWTNADLDVTPPERQLWTSVSVVGYWLSGILSVQTWMIGASILVIGLTWREAVWTILVGSIVMAFAIAFNGAPGAYLRVPFPVWIRSSFGYHGAKFPIICRMVTALFWHAIQTYAGSTAMTVMLTAIWPSYSDIPNHLPADAGITSQGLLSHFLFWSIQLPFLLIRPHRLKWFFVFKAFIATTAAVGTTIAVCVMAGGSGDIWNQEPTVSGWTRSWLIVSTLTAQTSSWSTVGANISDFTRYVKTPKSIYYQTIVFPVICFLIAFLGIVSASASKILYGEYVWDPLVLASKWTSPGGRAAAFYCGLAWMVAQIGVNVAANVISASNDLSSLFPKYLNIRRAAIICTIIGGWAMVPWKIITSAASLLNFMGSLAVFLAPIVGISISDYWVVKGRRIEVSELYNPHGRYAYRAGWNWRAIAAMLVGIGPVMPGLAANVNPSLDIGGAKYLGDLVWYYGFLSASVVYIGLNMCWPAQETLLLPDALTKSGLPPT
ncbi:permease for cytosine/purines, uracil, thiamine, allantoin-domain-containing protein [Hypoxylon rubiginosum]|uniref:Permease for cytosine/purines, uracil, thiamine, allantoin-domain-containing protein n=1 Tax=Hypoxylon rubiginosum TaxID=110542 RepID=A0ACB9YI24_9PEZI|nr:permease for cytosine/purines, uracil, thiamine, allantoin-domain-containing protein [Hypoxylon rubiginosum]